VAVRARDPQHLPRHFRCRSRPGAAITSDPAPESPRRTLCGSARDRREPPIRNCGTASPPRDGRVGTSVVTTTTDFATTTALTVVTAVIATAVLARTAHHRRRRLRLLPPPPRPRRRPLASRPGGGSPTGRSGGLGRIDGRLVGRLVDARNGPHVGPRRSRRRGHPGGPAARCPTTTAHRAASGRPQPPRSAPLAALAGRQSRPGA
jgi:hypothetical protein